MSDLIADLAQWATDFVYSSGYVGLAILIVLGNLHLPIPTQLTLPLAGFLIGQGHFSFAPVLMWTTAAAVAVSLFFYFVGLWIGEESLRRLILRLERFKLVFVADLEKASKVFERHGGKAILIGHLIPGIGAFISIPAGFKCMPIFGRFMIYTVLGCTLWNVAFIVLGWVLGSNWTIVERYVLTIEYVVLVVVAGGILWFLWRRWKARSDVTRPPRGRA